MKTSFSDLEPATIAEFRAALDYVIEFLCDIPANTMTPSGQTARATFLKLDASLKSMLAEAKKAQALADT